MSIVENHTSPDGEITLVVVDDGGEISVGFVDGNRDTTGEMISKLLSRSTAKAVRAFVTDVISGRHLLAVLSNGASITDIWIVDDPAKARGYAQHGESIRLRYWDGRPCKQA